MSLIKDTIIDVPVDDTDYDYVKHDKLVEEAEQARLDEIQEESTDLEEKLADMEELERDNQLER